VINRLPTRVKYGYMEDGTKVRISKKTGSVIPKPDREDCKYMNRVKDKGTSWFLMPYRDWT
jgi:hypothetical protein